MLIEAAPTIQAIQDVKSNHDGPVIMLSPRGERFSQPIANALALQPGMTLLCGRYEGFDERVRRHVDIDLSLGDFVLSGGTLQHGQSQMRLFEDCPWCLAMQTLLSMSLLKSVV